MTAVTAPVLAQPAPNGGAGATSAPDPTVEKVKQHYAAGRAAADSKRWQRAVDEFTKAYELKPLPQLAGNLGEAELRVGRYRDAAEHIAKALREYKGALPAEVKAAEEWLKEAKKQVVTLKITTEPGVEVIIDDKVVGTSPLPPEVYVDPGKHTVVGRVGTARDEVTDSYEAGWTRVIKLAPKAADAPQPTATADTSAVSRGSTIPQESGPRRGVVAGGSIIAGAGVGAGVALLISYVSMGPILEDARKGLERKCAGDGTGAGGQDARCQTLFSLIDERNRIVSAMTYSFIGAAVVGGATLAYWLSTPSGSSNGAPPVQAGAVVGPGGGGFVIHGAW